MQDNGSEPAASWTRSALSSAIRDNLGQDTRTLEGWPRPSRRSEMLAATVDAYIAHLIKGQSQHFGTEKPPGAK